MTFYTELNKHFHILVVLVILLNFNAVAQLNFYGMNKNENLYLVNPRDTISQTFCIDSIILNSKKIDIQLKNSILEVDFVSKNLQDNEVLNLKIFHKRNCKPSMVNPEVFIPKTTFEIADFRYTNDTLRWQTRNEHGSLMFYVEQYRWQNWQTVGEIQGTGSADLQTYTLPVKIHSGVNRFRIKQTDYTNVSRFSDELSYTSTIPEVLFLPVDGAKVSRLLEFSAPTEYEIYDYFGQFIISGFANIVDVSYLPEGTYFLKFDNSIASFTRR